VQYKSSEDGHYTADISDVRPKVLPGAWLESGTTMMLNFVKLAITYAVRTLNWYAVSDTLPRPKTRLM